MPPSVGRVKHLQLLLGMKWSESTFRPAAMITLIVLLFIAFAVVVPWTILGEARFPPRGTVLLTESVVAWQPAPPLSYHCVSLSGALRSHVR